jgi:hypothetical protein
MNVFLLSPGRTGTKTLAEAFGHLEGLTSAHESRTEYLGEARIDYPDNHVECDNRLTWFMQRLTKKYGKTGILVIVKRDVEKIASSYHKRWHKIYVMKAYSQGILMRDLKDNNLEVCRDYVDYVYETLEYFAPQWKTVVYVDIDSPGVGVKKLLDFMTRSEDYDTILQYIDENKSNQLRYGFKHKLDVIYFYFRCIIFDFFSNGR